MGFLCQWLLQGVSLPLLDCLCSAPVTKVFLSLIHFAVGTSPESGRTSEEGLGKREVCACHDFHLSVTAKVFGFYLIPSFGHRSLLQTCLWQFMFFNLILQVSEQWLGQAWQGTQPAGQSPPNHGNAFVHAILNYLISSICPRTIFECKKRTILNEPKNDWGTSESHFYFKWFLG